jgi:hypothetical protein
MQRTHIPAHECLEQGTLSCSLPLLLPLPLLVCTCCAALERI